MSDRPRRLQFHLSTGILGLLLCGVFVGVNSIPSKHVFGPHSGPPELVEYWYGCPNLVYRERSYPKEEGEWYFGSIISNMLLASVPVLLTVFIVERSIRRREGRKP